MCLVVYALKTNLFASSVLRFVVKHVSVALHAPNLLMQLACRAFSLGISVHTLTPPRVCMFVDCLMQTRLRR